MHLKVCDHPVVGWCMVILAIYLFIQNKVASKIHMQLKAAK